MADTAAPVAAQNSAAAPAAATVPTTQTAAPAAIAETSAGATQTAAGAAAPDWVPAQFATDWGTDGYAEKVSRAFADMHGKHSTRTDDLRKQVASEIEADRRRGLPEKPDGYIFKADPDSEVGKLLAKHKIKLVDSIPEGFVNTGDETHYALEQDSAVNGWWREFCHKRGLSEADFAEGIAQVIVRDTTSTIAARDARQKQFAAQDADELGKLGASGAQRKEAAIKGISDLVVKLLGTEKGAIAAASLGEAMYSAAAIEAAEQILKMASGGLSPGVGGQSAASPTFEQMFPRTAAYYSKR